MKSLVKLFCCHRAIIVLECSVLTSWKGFGPVRGLQFLCSWWRIGDWFSLYLLYLFNQWKFETAQCGFISCNFYTYGENDLAHLIKLFLTSSAWHKEARPVYLLIPHSKLDGLITTQKMQWFTRSYLIYHCLRKLGKFLPSPRTGDKVHKWHKPADTAFGR